MTVFPDRPGTIRAVEGADPVMFGNQLFAQGITDGLPIVCPTNSRVVAMLAGRDASGVLGALPPLFRPLSQADVAVCAVLAGCGPQHFPALLAAVDAIQAPEFNLLGVTTTTGTTAVGLVLHGPYADAVKANGAANCLGPGNQTNACLGRALALVLRNLGALPGVTDMATHGQPAKYGFCFAESREEFGWAPLHHERGHSAGSSAVTVVAFSGTAEVVDSHSVSAEGLMATLATALPVRGSMSADGLFLGSGQPVVIIPREWATQLVAAGWSREDAGAYLYEHSKVAVSSLAPGIADGLDDGVRALGTIAVAEGPQSVVLIVAGGVGTKATYLPTWQGGTRIVTRALDY
jgi:hypothetical protein